MLDRIVSWLHCLAEQRALRLQSEAPRSRISFGRHSSFLKPAGAGTIRKATLDWLGGYGGGVSTRSHPELGRESPQRRWYCVLRHGRVGRRQAYQAPPLCFASHVRCYAYFRYSLFNLVARDLRPLTLRIDGDAGWSSPVARQAHNLKVEGSNPSPATTESLTPVRFLFFCPTNIRMPARSPCSVAVTSPRLGPGRRLTLLTRERMSSAASRAAS